MEPHWLQTHCDALLLHPGAFYAPSPMLRQGSPSILGEGAGLASRAARFGICPRLAGAGSLPMRCQGEDVEQSQLCAANINYPLTALQAAIRSQLSDSCSQPEGCSGGGAAGRCQGLPWEGPHTAASPRVGQRGFGRWHFAFCAKCSPPSVLRGRSSHQLSIPATGGQGGFAVARNFSFACCFIPPNRVTQSRCGHL